MPEVAEDAGPDVPARDRSQPWAWLLAGLLVGAGATFLFVGSGSPPSPSVVTFPTTSSTIDPGSEGISHAVPGFPDGLVATVRREGQNQEFLLWPVAGPPLRRPIPVASPTPPVVVSFDRSGRRIASLIRGPEGVGDLLYAGVPDSASLIAIDATGYAWHDSAPARLAYSTFTDGETVLWSADGDQSQGEVVTRAIGIEGGVVAYGDWGFAFHDEDTIVVLTHDGEIKAVNTGAVLDSHPSGWMLVEDDGLWLLSSGGGLRGLRPEPVLEGGPVAGRFSPDGDLLAVLAPTALHLLSTDSQSVLAPVSLRPRSPAEVRWSSDGRFLLVPQVRGLLVVDVGTGVTRRVLEGEILTGIGVNPLRDS